MVLFIMHMLAFLSASPSVAAQSPAWTEVADVEIVEP